MSNLTDNDMAQLLNNTKVKEKEAVRQPKKETANITTGVMKANDASDVITRCINFIGAGDAGANVSSAVYDAGIGGTIIYNTSKRNIDRLNYDYLIIPNTEDGSGKDREYSKEVFKQGSHNNLKQFVDKLSEGSKWIYNIVCSSTDGGTGGGMSPNAALHLFKETKNPTLLLGIYPSLQDDVVSQFNALKWQSEVEKINLPYMIFDNNRFSSMGDITAHTKVNNEIVRAMEVFSGVLYGECELYDNRDFLRLISRGGRINVYTNTREFKVEETLFEYLQDMINSSSQPKPVNAQSYGLFVKGPKDFVDNLNTDLEELFEMYGGLEKGIHLEVDEDETIISLIISGSSTPNSRTKSIKKRYNDLVNSQKVEESITNDLLSDIVNPGMGFIGRKEESSTELNALDI